jgi:hypothetical protein
VSRPRPAAGLPHLREIFDDLRRGRHISEVDGDRYWALKDGFDKYAAFFDQIGFTLNAHGRGFYYFQAAGDLSDRARRMAVFMFILIEHLADSGEAIEQSLFTRSFRVADLPHFRSDRYRGYMREADMATEEGLANVLRGMEQCGFLCRQSEQEFRFLRPAYRFMDLCLQILAEGEAETGTPSPAPTSSEPDRGPPRSDRLDLEEGAEDDP